MKVQIQREALAGAMRLVNMAVADNSPKPILSCVRLAADGGKVQIHGTNLDTSVLYEVAHAIVDEPGVVLIKASLLASIVAAGKCDVLVIQSTENGCKVVEDDGKYELLGIDPKGYPPFPADAGEFDSVMPLEQFRAGVRRTEFAVSKTASRYTMNGVFLKQGNGQARLVATDGRRLACCQLEDEAKMESKGIVPPKAMRILSAISEETGTIKVKVRGAQAWFECGPLSMATNLLAGTFPDYEKIIPKDSKVKLTLPTSMTLAAIRKAAIMRPDDDGGVYLSLSANRLVFEARDHKGVAGEAAVPVQYAGEPMVMKFTPEFVTDALKVIGAETFGLELQSPNDPGLIRGPQDYVYVFMPITMQ